MKTYVCPKCNLTTRTLGREVGHRCPNAANPPANKRAKAGDWVNAELQEPPCT